MPTASVNDTSATNGVAVVRPSSSATSGKANTASPKPKVDRTSAASKITANDPNSADTTRRAYRSNGNRVFRYGKRYSKRVFGDLGSVVITRSGERYS